MTEVQQRELDELGYTLLPGFIAPPLLAELSSAVDAVYAQEGERAGSEFKIEPDTKRLANMVDKGEVFRSLVAIPEVLELVGHVIPGQFKLGSFNARAPNPQSDWIQPLHCDAGALPDEKGYWVCNVVWMLDDFTAENGATRVVPGTHKSGRYPQDVLADPMAPHPDEVLVIAPAGTVAVINTHAWHGGTANRSGGARRCLHVFYTRWDKPQQQFQRDMLSEETKRNLSPQLRHLLAIDDEENARISLADPFRSGFLK